MEKWAKQAEMAAPDAAATNQSPRKETPRTKNKEASLLNSSPLGSRVELSSYFDCSEVRGSEYEPFFPRKNESLAVQTFKKTILETAIKPKSWKDHRDRIEKSQRLLDNRQRQLEGKEETRKQEIKTRGGSDLFALANDSSLSRQTAQKVR